MLVDNISLLVFGQFQVNIPKHYISEALYENKQDNNSLKFNAEQDDIDLEQADFNFDNFIQPNSSWYSKSEDRFLKINDSIIFTVMK